MSEIIDATYNFLDNLDNSDIIKNITKYRKRLLNNKEILSKISDIQKENDDNKLIMGRKKTYDNNDYKMYMKYYNELSLIIMNINNKYKEYTNTYEHNCKR